MSDKKLVAKLTRMAKIATAAPVRKGPLGDFLEPIRQLRQHGWGYGPIAHWLAENGGVEVTPDAIRKFCVRHDLVKQGPASKGTRAAAKSQSVDYVAELRERAQRQRANQSAKSSETKDPDRTNKDRWKV